MTSAKRNHKSRQGATSNALKIIYFHIGAVSASSFHPIILNTFKIMSNQHPGLRKDRRRAAHATCTADAISLSRTMAALHLSYRRHGEPGLRQRKLKASQQGRVRTYPQPDPLLHRNERWAGASLHTKSGCRACCRELAPIDVVEIEFCAQAPADHQNRKQQQGALREAS
jgi:hypothetical protein